MVVIVPKEQVTVEEASVVKVKLAVEVEIVESSAGPEVIMTHGGVLVLTVPEPVPEPEVDPVDVAVEPVPFEPFPVEVDKLESNMTCSWGAASAMFPFASFTFGSLESMETVPFGAFTATSNVYTLEET